MKSTLPSTLLDPAHADKFQEFFQIVQDAVYQWAQDKGWWDEERSEGELIALMHSELSEGLEYLRKPRKVKCPHCGGTDTKLFDKNPDSLGRGSWSCEGRCAMGSNGNVFGGPLVDWQMSDHIPEFAGIEEELADVIIRIMDFGAHHKLRIAEAIIAKMIFNHAREHKHGGKKF